MSGGPKLPSLLKQWAKIDPFSDQDINIQLTALSLLI